MKRMIVLLLLAGPAWGQTVPTTGKEAPGLEPLDRAVLTIMDRHGVPGASLAIALEGKLVFARGYGWSNIGNGTHATPTTMFGLASVSKTITAAAVMHMVEDGKIGLDDPAFSHLKHLNPPKGAKVDPRLHRITVRHLLNHSGGWDRNKSGDPLTWTPVITRRMGVRAPVGQDTFLSFMMSVPLDFDPGTRAVYSNVGYSALARIVSKVSGMSYEEYVRKNVLEPAGVKSGVHHLGRAEFFKGEAHSYLAGTINPLPPPQLPMVQGAMGWSLSAVDTVRFLTALDGSRGKRLVKPETHKAMLAAPPAPIKPNAEGRYMGLGFSLVTPTKDGIVCVQDGHYYGMRAFVKRNAAGVNWALLFNASMQPDGVDIKVINGAIHEIRDLVDSMKKFPKVDLFADYP